jgi:hypothetical protein
MVGLLSSPSRSVARPRYGDPLDTDFKAISDRLDAARNRLEQVAKVYRNAKRS